jgi:beta-glucosidase/6-phospho-beta-glucosidase/beta-galactosidase
MISFLGSHFPFLSAPRLIIQALNDTFRVRYLHDYISSMAVARDAGVPVKGYFVWSLMDNFEWADGYSKRFGIHYVQYDTPEKNRTPKQSATWFGSLAQTGRIPPAP